MKALLAILCAVAAVIVGVLALAWDAPVLMFVSLAAGGAGCLLSAWFEFSDS